MFAIPILLICFNRPTHTSKVLEQIMKLAPKNLYVFQDHWRVDHAGEQEQCVRVKKVIEEWVAASPHTILHYQTPDCNLGCGPGPMTGINWFFSENEMGIIIEDDAVPHLDFFGYCEQLLERYKEDESVRAIGSMHLDDRTYGDGSYYFSMMNRTFCAWATWARAWKDFDLYHRNVSRKQLDSVLKNYGCALRMREYWCDRLAEVQKDAYHHSSWDQQFWMSIWLHHGKGIMPNVNLCTNIGFDEYGTHTTDASSSGANRKTFPILPLQHPSDCCIHHDADQRFQEIYFEPWQYGWSGFKRLYIRLNKRLKRLVGHEGSWITKKITMHEAFERWKERI